jgi:iron complex outermembrane receptor protein
MQINNRFSLTGIALLFIAKFLMLTPQQVFAQEKNFSQDQSVANQSQSTKKNQSATQNQTAKQKSELRKAMLEEVIVTAERREVSLQKTPIAVSVLSHEQLEAQGINSLEALEGGAIPSVEAMSAGNPSTTVAFAIRGNGPVDIMPVTREQTVGLYIDGIYLGRPQGLDMEVPDLERIEVLRGPQGTLFGRNTTSGAIGLVTRKPGDQFAFEQLIGAGNYDALRSVTRLNLPELGGVRSKIDYVHAQRDGWVGNDAPGQWDYNAYEKDGGRLSLNYSPIDTVVIDFAYDKSRTVSTSNYFQLYTDVFGFVGNERDRDMHTRAPIPNQPTHIYQDGYALTISWDISEQLTLKSLTGYRKLHEDSFTSFGAALYYNGALNFTEDREHQFSQELQLLGKADHIDWVAGLYYFDGRATQQTDLRFALDTFGTQPGNAGLVNVPIDPPADLGVPRRYVAANTESDAAYAQLTWTTPFDEHLHLTAGLRYTRDKKDGHKIEIGDVPYDIDAHHWDSTLIVDYAWTEALSTYLKRSTGYRSGSVNPRSASFEPYDAETVTTWEGGLKSEFWQHRLRANAALFRSYWHKMQFDFVAPTSADINNTETLNAEKSVRVEGAELDLAATPLDGLVLGLSYTYLHDHMPLQPNKLESGALQQFQITQTPRHAGAATVDYTFAPLPLGTITAHIDATSNSGYAHNAHDTQRQDGYTLLNARLALTDIPLAGYGKLQLALWGKNLTDEEYVNFGFPLADPPIAIVQSFGDPRTYGVDLTYKY